MGYAPKFFGVDGMDGILTMEGFDSKLAEGVMLLTPFNADATDDKTASFVKKYKEQFGETPNQFAADAYDCVYAYKQALENAGATPDMSAEDLCDKMIEQFTSMTFDGLTGEGMTWDETGAVSKCPEGHGYRERRLRWYVRPSKGDSVPLRYQKVPRKLSGYPLRLCTAKAVAPPRRGQRCPERAKLARDILRTQGRVKEVWKQSSFTAIYKEVYLYRRAGCPAEKVSSTESYGVGRWLDHCRTTAPFHKQEK